jgi:ABC-type proline/glycine betaine transport system permease subunit
MADGQVIAAIAAVALIAAVGLCAVLVTNKLGPYTIGLSLVIFALALYVILYLLGKVEVGFGEVFTAISGFGMGLITTKFQGQADEKKRTIRTESK